MTGSQEKSEKMAKQKRGRSLLAFSGGAALLAFAVNLVITAIKHQKETNRRKKGLIISYFLSLVAMQFGLTCCADLIRNFLINFALNANILF